MSQRAAPVIGDAGPVTEQDHVQVNRSHWDGQADDWVASGERSWAESNPTWGMWEIPESELGLLPADMTGLHTIELGCGTGYVSAWLARRGADVVGLDNSARQLATAQRLSARHELRLPLLHGDAERLPFRDGCFDLAVSEYGAAIWCDPYTWIPEAHRVLRPGGELLFLGTGTLAMVCSPLDGSVPVTRRLERDYFGLHRLDWTAAVDDPGGVEFNLPISDWIGLFRRTGFEILDFRELQAPAGGPEVRYFASAEWSSRFPSEQVWHLRRH